MNVLNSEANFRIHTIKGLFLSLPCILVLRCVYRYVWTKSNYYSRPVWTKFFTSSMTLNYTFQWIETNFLADGNKKKKYNCFAFRTKEKLWLDSAALSGGETCQLNSLDCSYFYLGGPLCLTIDLLHSVNPKNHLTRKRSRKLIFPIQRGLSHWLQYYFWFNSSWLTAPVILLLRNTWCNQHSHGIKLIKVITFKTLARSPCRGSVAWLGERREGRKRKRKKCRVGGWRVKPFPSFSVCFPFLSISSASTLPGSRQHKTTFCRGERDKNASLTWSR